MNENRFDGKGEVYTKFRPGYPREFIDHLYSEIGLTGGSVIADIGSGTGKLTGQLLERGSKVFAVEPNPDMRKIAESNFKGVNNFVSVNASAENTTLEDKSVDFITVAQAFHWFDRESFKRECRRILKENGKVILVWNNRDETSDIVKENYEVNKRFCPGFKGFSGGMTESANIDALKYFFEGDYEIKVFENHLKFDESGFIGRNLSSSYSLKSDERGYMDYIAELKKIFEKYSNDGLLLMPNLTCSYIGRVVKADKS